MSLGVTEANPASFDGMLKLMSGLHEYVPQPDGYLHSLMSCGDRLVVERQLGVLRARSDGADPASRLEGLVPIPQEFHKRGIFLQACF